MKSKPVRTAFILGAGASKPYGFPTAYELRELILGRATGDFLSWADCFRGQFKTVWQDWLRGNLPSCMSDSASLQAFQTAFCVSDVYSIDKFVFQHERHAEAAKHYIALILLECEQKKKPTGGWYGHIWNEIIIPGATAGRQTLKFFTFNYDRSLESYLDSVTKTYFSDPEFGRAVYDRIEIRHIYGSLGQLRGPTNTVSYGSREPSALQLSASQLRLIPPRISSRDWPKEDLLEFERLVFLGFGFDELNMEVLGLTRTERPKEIFASCFGLSTARLAAAETRLGEIKWGELDEDVNTYLHKSMALSGL